MFLDEQRGRKHRGMQVAVELCKDVGCVGGGWKVSAWT